MRCFPTFQNITCSNQYGLSSPVTTEMNTTEIWRVLEMPAQLEIPLYSFTSARVFSSSVPGRPLERVTVDTQEPGLTG